MAPGCRSGALVLAALSELGFGPTGAPAPAAGIFLGGAVDLPVRRIPREETLEVPRAGFFALGRLAPRLVRRRTHTALAPGLAAAVVATLLA